MVPTHTCNTVTTTKGLELCACKRRRACTHEEGKDKKHLEQNGVTSELTGHDPVGNRFKNTRRTLPRDASRPRLTTIGFTNGTPHDNAVADVGTLALWADLAAHVHCPSVSPAHHQVVEAEWTELHPGTKCLICTLHKDMLRRWRGVTRGCRSVW